MAPSGNVAVVGAGIVGLASARALRDRGLGVTVYERHVPGGGQSAGRTRIFRLNHDDPRLIGLAQAARRIWRRWEHEHGASLVGRDGVLVAGPRAAARLDGLRAAGADAAWIDEREQAQLLPPLRPLAGPVLADRGGGPIRAAAAIAALARDLGGALRQAEVLAVRPVSGPGVEVLTPQGSHGHDAAVLCAGADTVRLAAQLGLSLPVEHALHLRATFDVRGAAPDRAACLQDATGQHGETVYGSPWPSRERFAVGISGDSGEVRGAQLDRFGELRTRLCAYVRAALPGLDPAPVGDVTCRVTRLPWGGDGVAAWQIGAVTAVAGNNMFKLAPVLGELLADAVCGAGVPAILRPETQLGRPGG